MRRFLLSVILMIHCTFVQGSEVDQAMPAATVPMPPAKMQLVLSIVWHGRSLAVHDLEALDALRRTHPNLSVIHLLSPTYFLRRDLREDAGKIRPRVEEGDGVGIYLAAWKSLLDQSGVAMRREPTFWGSTQLDCTIDCGEDIPLSFFQETAVGTIFTTGMDVLKTAGFGPLEAYAVAGYLADATLAQTAATRGIHMDLNPVPPAHLRRLRHYPLHGWLTELWRDLDSQSSPYPREAGSVSLTALPLTGGTLELRSMTEILAQVETQLERLKVHGGSELVHLQLSQETAAQYAPVMSQVLAAIKDKVARHRVEIVFDAFTRPPTSTRDGSMEKRLPLAH